MGHIFSQLALIGEQFSFLGGKIRLGLLLKCFILSSVGIVFIKTIRNLYLKIYSCTRQSFHTAWASSPVAGKSHQQEQIKGERIRFCSVEGTSWRQRSWSSKQLVTLHPQTWNREAKCVVSVLHIVYVCIVRTLCPENMPTQLRWVFPHQLKKSREFSTVLPLSSQVILGSVKLMDNTNSKIHLWLIDFSVWFLDGKMLGEFLKVIHWMAVKSA